VSSCVSSVVVLEEKVYPVQRRDGHRARRVGPVADFAVSNETVAEDATRLRERLSEVKLRFHINVHTTVNG